MGLSDLEKLKQLSWYTTVPLFVFAWFLHEEAYLNPELLTIYGGVSIVASYFIPIVITLFFSFCAWLGLMYKMESGTDIFFTLLLATFILSIAGTGVGISLMKPANISLSYNIFWFLGLGSVAFNLYQLVESNVKAREQARIDASTKLDSSR